MELYIKLRINAMEKHYTSRSVLLTFKMRGRNHRLLLIKLIFIKLVVANIARILITSIRIKSI